MSGAEIFLLAASAGLGAVSQYQQGRANEANANAQAGAAFQQAKLSRMNAENVARQANAREELQRKQARIAIGNQLAASAQSGLQLNGSNADLLEESLTNAELDALNIRYEGQVNSTGLLNQANMQDFEAANYRSQAKQARRAGIMSAAATLTGAGYKASQIK